MSAYARWAENHAAGVAPAADKTARNRAAAQQSATANRQRGGCAIKDCKNTARRGELCAKHTRMIPLAEKMALVFECMESQRKIAARHHRRWARELKARLGG